MWVHLLPGRARARVPAIRRHQQRASRLQQRLSMYPGILVCQASAVTGTVLIRFDPGTLTPDVLACLLDSATIEPQTRAEVAASTELARTLYSPIETTAIQSNPSDGLSTAEANRLLEAYGANALRAPMPPPLLLRFAAQYKDPIQLLMLGGAGLSFASGRYGDGLTMGGVSLVNSAIGASGAGRGAHSVEALRSLTPRWAQVMRDGTQQIIPVENLVPGDLMRLESGDRVPADGLLQLSVGLAVDESLLTGESLPVEKRAGIDHLHAGTTIVRGRCTALVTATGNASSLGRIAELLDCEPPLAPLQKRMNTLSQRLTRSGFWIAAGAACMGLLRGQGLIGALLTGVSLAISAVPEGLPAFTTLALSNSARRMAQHNIRFQSLAAVESMGAITALCCDKTGTLTYGEMAVVEVRLPNGVWRVTGSGYAPEGQFIRNGRNADPMQDRALRRLLQVASLCTNARIGLDEQGSLFTSGDSTEIAMLVAALKAGLRISGGEGSRIGEIPFDAYRRRMSVLCANGDGRTIACVKGAPEAVLPLCSDLFIDGKIESLSSRLRRRLARATKAMAARGLRVLAVAYRPLDAHASGEEMERDLILLGLVGLADQPRLEAATAVARCQQAGIRVMMITGDHPFTATAVAKQIGLTAGPGALLTGDDLATLSDSALDERLARATIIARATPEQKLRIVQGLRRCNHIVAMTGDGVNDAPAMQESDVGIGMRERGTEVACATAGLVLEDDNLQGIVQAIEQGRAMQQNITRMSEYLLGTNTAEVCVMATTLLLGLPLPFLPAQLLWMNLASDSLPATALGAEPPEPNVMNRPPTAGSDWAGLHFGRRVATHGLRMGLGATSLYIWALASGRSLAQARTLVMAALTAGQVLHLGAHRTSSRSPQVQGARYAVAAFALVAIYLPPLRRAMQFAALGAPDLLMALATAWLASGRGVKRPVPRLAQQPLSRARIAPLQPGLAAPRPSRPASI